MNLGKFNTVINQLHDYYETNDIAKLFQLLLDTLEANWPTQTPESVQLFRKQLDAILDAVKDVPNYSNMASFIEVIKGTSGLDYFGIGLEDALKKIIYKQFVSSVEMLSELQSFQKNLLAYISNVKKLSAGLTSLQVEFDDFKEEEFEFSALLPKELVGTTLENIQAELQHIDRLFKCLNELMGKGNTSPEVKTISSSWWQFFLSLDETQIAAITFALERIVNLYKTSLEIRKLKADAEKQELDAEIIGKLDQEVEKKVKEGMARIAKEIRKQYQSNDDKARCNELETQLRQELTVIAKRLNQGALYEVKAALPNKPEEPEISLDGTVETAEKKLHEKQLEIYQEKLDKANKINVINEMIIEASEGMIENQNMMLLDYDKLNE